jgi:uncharacterized protein YjdB
MLKNRRLRVEGWATRAAAAALVAFGTACSGGTEPPRGNVEVVAVAPAAVSVPIGSTIQLSAQALGAERAELPGRSAAWASADSSVASVSPTGMVTARKLGSVQIQAAIEGRSAYSFVSVVPRPVGAVAVSPGSATVAAGATTQLQATVTDDRGGAITDQPLVWRSSNDAAARVTSTGLVSGAGPGTATITATAGEGKTGSAAVTVTGSVAGGGATGGAGGGTTTAPVVVGRVAVQPGPAAPAIAVDDTMQLTATAFDAADALVTGRAVTWATSNAAVATVVASTGVVRGVGVGEAIISATIDGKSASTTVTITRRVARTVDITAPPEVTVGQQVQLTATPRDVAGRPLVGRTIIWTSNNESVVAVGRTTGLAEARGTGPAGITASVEGEGVVNNTTIIAKAPSGPTGGQGPTANFVFGCTNLVCAFTDRSVVADGAQPTWRWEFGNNTTSPFRNSDVVYDAPGTYTVTLTVTDDKGVTSSVSKTVTVVTTAPAVQLVNRATGKCLSVAVTGAADPRGAAVVTRTCDGGPDQRFALPTGAGVGPLQLVRYSNRYVELPPLEDEPLRAWQWNGAQFQRWSYANTGELRHFVTDRCITATASSASLSAESCSAQDSQRWEARP